MTDITLTLALYAGLAGLLGAGLYIVYNHLVSQALYLTAIEHAVAGFIAGIAGVLFLGYIAPTSILDAFPLVVLGYFGVDVIDSLAQDIAATPPVVTPPAAPKA